MNEFEIGQPASGLAYVGMIVSVSSIKDADRIEAIEVVCGSGGKWSAVAQRGQFAVGDKCEIYLQDSILPEDDDRFSFMEKYRFRVKMIRLRGVPSEALVVDLADDIDPKTKVGTDITHLRKVKKYTKALPANLAGIARGNFPSFIPKTDEVNFQKVPKIVAAMQDDWFVVTEKCDGTSCTFYHDPADGHFGVCSRNIEYKHSKDSVYWRLAEKYGIEAILKDHPGYAIQAEGVGPGIQKNPMGLPDIEIRVFDIYDINGGFYLDGTEIYEFCKEYNLPMVRVLYTMEAASMSDDDWRALAEGEYENGNQREGIVVRPIVDTWLYNQRMSFKVINLLYNED